jgi:hypothetical protein
MSNTALCSGDVEGGDHTPVRRGRLAGEQRETATGHGLVVFTLVINGLLDDQPTWLSTVVTGLLGLGVFSLVEMIDGGVR